jgi:arylsulfatase A-like enzyme
MKRPNLLIFMTDQQQQAVTTHSHPCRTPNVDRLSKDGLTFNRMYTTMTHCCPSRASFMTGLYPSQHGVHNNLCNQPALSKGLKPGVATFAEMLKDAGYSMHYSGKWHVSTEENPSDRGWETLELTAGKDAKMGFSIDDWRRQSSKPEEGSREEGEITRPGWGNYRLYGTSPQSIHETSDYRVVQKAVEQLDSLSGQEKPWCMYVGVLGPHDPFIVPEPYSSMYDWKNVSLPPSYRDDLLDKPAVYRKMRRVWDQLSEEEVKASIAHYWGYCSMVDDLLGLVLDKLDETGQANDTIVVYLSDHGESLAAHGLYLKGISPFEETYRIPCIVRWPEGIKNPNRQIDSLTSIMDWAPTFLDLADAKVINNMSGRSLTPFISDEKPKRWRDAVYAQCNGVEVYYTYRMVISDRYKFVYHPTDVDELYDLKEDPYEMNNLAEEPGMQEIKKQMYMLMWRELADADDIVFNQYPTVATADYGPAMAIGTD